MLLSNPVPNMFCLLSLATKDIWWHHNDLSRLVRKVLLAFQWFMICSSWLPSHLSTFYFALYKPASCITDVHEHESLNKYSPIVPRLSPAFAVPRLPKQIHGGIICTVTMRRGTHREEVQVLNRALGNGDLQWQLGGNREWLVNRFIVVCMRGSAPQTWYG